MDIDDNVTLGQLLESLTYMVQEHPDWKEFPIVMENPNGVGVSNFFGEIEHVFVDRYELQSDPENVGLVSEDDGPGFMMTLCDEGLIDEFDTDNRVRQILVIN